MKETQDESSKSIASEIKLAATQDLGGKKNIIPSPKHKQKQNNNMELTCEILTHLYLLTLPLAMIPLILRAYHLM